MAYKRIIGVLTVRHGLLVKSYGYGDWRPAGNLGTALKNLDRWAADEIIVLDISRRGGLDPGVLRQVASAKISTPLAYGGGIRHEDDIARLMELGCDRFVVESVLFEDPGTLARMADLAGRQALVGSLPLCFHEGNLSVWRPGIPGGIALSETWREYLRDSLVSEFFISAVEAEGCAGRFPLRLPTLLEWLPGRACIWFGGLDGMLAAACLANPLTAAVAFGNPLLEAELALPRMRNALLGSSGIPAIRVARTITT